MIHLLFEIVLIICIITGISLLFQNLLSLKHGEGNIVSAGLIVFVMFVMASAHHIQATKFIAILLALAGILLAALVKWKKKEKISFADFPISYGLMLLLAILSVLLFSMGQIHLEEEFHYWADGIRTIYENQKISMGYTMDGASPAISLYSALGLFSTFCMTFTGYHEATMYIGVFLLSAFGILLPLSGCSMKDWKKASLYLLILFAAIYTLFEFGWYSLCPAIPLASWAGGFLGWWQIREENKKNLILIPFVFGVIFMMCNNVGLMMDILLGAYMISDILSKNSQGSKHGQKKTPNGIKTFVLIAGSIGVLTLGVILIFSILHIETSVFAKLFHIRELLADRHKFPEHGGSYLSLFFGYPLGKQSRIAMGCVGAVMILSIFEGILAGFREEKKKECFQIIYMILATVAYGIFNYVVYCVFYASDEIHGLDYGVRGLSVLAITFFIMEVTRLLYDVKLEEKKIGTYVMVAVFLFFLTGWNEGFIGYNTSWNLMYYERGETILEMKKASEMVNDMKLDGKIYLLNQSDDVKKINLEDGSYPYMVATYYLRGEISDYTKTPWKFTALGYFQGDEYHEGSQSHKIEKYLDGYDYVWLYKSSPYFEELMAEKKGLLKEEVDFEYGKIYRIMK